MRKKVLVVQHVPGEGLGIIGPGLESHGMDAHFVRIFKNGEIPDTLDGYAGLIVLGGPMGVYEEKIYPFITKELNLLESALRDAKPVLGICLGAQLLAKAAGANVYKGHAKEIGWSKVRLNEDGRSDRLFRALPEELTVFQLHGDTFDLPRGGVLLASSDVYPNQAIRVGSRAYGLQFHIEVTERMVADWIQMNIEDIVAMNLQNARSCATPGNIALQTGPNLSSMTGAGRAIIARFLRMMYF